MPAAAAAVVVVAVVVGSDAATAEELEGKTVVRILNNSW